MDLIYETKPKRKKKKDAYSCHCHYGNSGQNMLQGKDYGQSLHSLAAQNMFTYVTHHIRGLAYRRHLHVGFDVGK